MEGHGYAMSFSSDIKKEIIKLEIANRHCAIAELAGIASICGDMGRGVLVCSENKLVIGRSMDLVGYVFPREDVCKVQRHDMVVQGDQAAEKVSQTLKMDGGVPNQIIHTRQCCKKAYIRGCFLAFGSMCDPRKAYHFEVACPVYGAALMLKNALAGFGIEGKVVKRGRHSILYVKEGEQVVDLLNIIGAHVALMELENIRILKDIRNVVNRQVNCETANLNKTVVAASKQVDDILYIKENKSLGMLPENLREVAELRIEYPDATLVELGSMLGRPIGKSGVNHRLRKISEVADGLRERG